MPKFYHNQRSSLEVVEFKVVNIINAIANQLRLNKSEM